MLTPALVLAHVDPHPRPLLCRDLRKLAVIPDAGMRALLRRYAGLPEKKGVENQPLDPAEYDQLLKWCRDQFVPGHGAEAGHTAASRLAAVLSKLVQPTMRGFNGLAPPAWRRFLAAISKDYPVSGQWVEE